MRGVRTCFVLWFSVRASGREGAEKEKASGGGENLIRNRDPGPGRTKQRTATQNAGGEKGNRPWSTQLSHTRRNPQQAAKGTNPQQASAIPGRYENGGGSGEAGPESVVRRAHGWWCVAVATTGAWKEAVLLGGGSGKKRRRKR